MPESVENLEIWQDGMRIVKSLYKLTNGWPKEEKYGLTGQIRRAAVSIPANIAEGLGRGSFQEAARFAQISLGSLYELDTLIKIAHELKYMKKSDYKRLKDQLSVLARRISSYISYQEDKVDSS